MQEIYLLASCIPNSIGERMSSSIGSQNGRGFKLRHFHPQQATRTARDLLSIPLDPTQTRGTARQQP
jgi:hypothetical protein